MPATLRYFRELHSGTPEINYGNTVVVQRDNGQWWLGYVQDIEGDRFFVDFDAGTVSAQWIHAKHLWPHHFIGDLDLLKLPGFPAYVALRDEVRGSLSFRCATIIEDLRCMFCAVYLDNSLDRRIVPVRHLISQLPSVDGKPSFFARAHGLVYRKHIVDFGQPYRLRHVKFMPKFLAETCQLALDQGSRPCSASCRFKKFTFGLDGFSFRCTGEHYQTGEHHVFSVRTFVRAAVDTVTFICAEIHADAAGRSMFWTVSFLKEACQQYLSEQQPLDLQLRVSLTVAKCPTDGWMVGEVPDESEEMGITHLSADVLQCVLWDLDILTKFRISHVCALWRLVEREPASRRHVIFVISPLPESDPWGRLVTMAFCANEAYTFSLLLEGSISANTRAVALVDERTPEERSFVQQRGYRSDEFALRMQLFGGTVRKKGLRLPLLIAKNGNEDPSFVGLPFLELRANDRTGRNYECQALSSAARGWMSACVELWLINYTASCQISFHAYHTGVVWPRDEEAFLWNIGGGRLDIVVAPLLRFRCTDTAAEHSRRFLAGLNDSCPAVTQRVLEKVTTIHSRWVRTFDYSDQWAGIGCFIRMFNSFCADGSPQYWDQVDLRQLDVSSLNRLTCAVLDAYYKD